MSEFTDTLLAQARATLGTHEEGGKNRGGSVDTWNRNAGVPLGSPWCASWVFNMHRDACAVSGLPNPCPRTGSSIALWTSADPARRSQLPAPGDVFVCDHGRNVEGTRVGHCGIVESVSPDGRTVTTIEGNTNDAGSREGNAVARHTWNPTAGARGTLLGYVSYAPDETAFREAQARGEAT